MDIQFLFVSIWVDLLYESALFWHLHVSFCTAENGQETVTDSCEEGSNQSLPWSRLLRKEDYIEAQV